MSEIDALRKSLAISSEALTPEEKAKLALGAIAAVAAALSRGVGNYGPWEQRCLTAALSMMRSRRYDEARSLARQALWPVENRRGLSSVRLPLTQSMLSLKEILAELQILRNRY